MPQSHLKVSSAVADETLGLNNKYIRRQHNSPAIFSNIDLSGRESLHFTVSVLPQIVDYHFIEYTARCEVVA